MDGFTATSDGLPPAAGADPGTVNRGTTENQNLRFSYRAQAKF